MMTFIRAFFYLLALPALIGVLLGYFGSVHASLDSIAHFRLHLAVIAAAGGLLLMLVRRRAAGFLVTASALVSLAFHAEQIPGQLISAMHGQARALIQQQVGNRLGLTFWQPAAAAANWPRYTLLHANLRFDNPDPKGFLRLAGEVNADVMTLNEVSKQWLPALEILEAAYPHQLVCSADSAIGGVAILSKRPFVDNAENGCSNAGVLALQHVDFGGREAVVGSAHLFWPWPHGQSGQISAMRERLRSNGKAGMPMIFAGDLNAVRWSHSAKRIASFLSARRVPVAGGTWLHHTAPADYISWFGLPIDNVMARGIIVTNAGTLAPFGSDHLAVRAEFVLPAKEQEGAAGTLAK